MKHKKIILATVATFLSTICAHAQYAWQENERERSAANIGQGLGYTIEMQGSVAKGKTPLWLNANKYGLSSLEKNNGYIRAAAIRRLAADSARRWAVGYGLDMAVPVNYTSNVVVQQAFVQLRWLHGVLSIGAKEEPMELKNQTLSSGSQTLGINARPVPQVRVALPEYWTLPFAHGWLHLKGHIAFGMMTDDSWQHDFTKRQSNFTDHTLYHSKAGYLKIGNDNSNCPLSLEVGLEMAAQFGGNAYRPDGKGGLIQIPTKKNLKSFWNAFIPGGRDITDGVYSNVEGNMLGSWVARVNYDSELWRLSVYGDHYFEDHSQMFLLDYDGYGTGAEWDVKKKHRFFMYDLKDIMLGGELEMKYGRWLRHVVVEYLYTKYQSGPIYHDHTENMPDHIGGTDNYYNHGTYPGWEHWGQVMGNPLYRSPVYNTDGHVCIEDNRFSAWHLGVDGSPAERIDYRALATYQTGWGTYGLPFDRPHHNVSFLLEGTYKLNHGWRIKAGYGMDFGSNRMLGHNAGGQLTIRKSGLFGKKQRH